MFAECLPPHYKERDMSENALFNGERVKIGTCECMYYLRWQDRWKVDPLPNNLDPRTMAGLFFRLPFPDEDCLQPGEYNDHMRGDRLGRREPEGERSFWNDWTPEDTADMDPGLLQVSHKSGLLLNVPCHHGIKLPETGEVKAFWNGKCHHFELYMVKHVGNGVLRPVYHCRWCGSMWSTDWESILPFCGLDAEMERRLHAYAEGSTVHVAA